MAVESHFERLEQEVGRLVEVLGTLRQENIELKARLDGLEKETEQLKSENTRLTRVEEQFQEVAQSRDAIRGRIESLLTKLDAVEI
jgi:FtsZ-binding cell division protein ZapB